MSDSQNLRSRFWLDHHRRFILVAGGAEKDVFEICVAGAFGEFLGNFFHRAVGHFFAALEDEDVGANLLDEMEEV